ncbi:MAG: methyltransferase domain-containing protein [Thermodesulfobacteriota bacterium]
MREIRLNLGCASITPEGWINVDFALGAWFAKIPFFRLINKKIKLFNTDWNAKVMLHDLRRDLPWQNNAVNYIYCSHTLEHFSKNEGRRVRSECYRVLKPGGVVRILVPDLKTLVMDYIRGEISADDFLDRLGCCYGDRRFSAFISFPHKCMYDASALMRVMESVNFICHIRNPYESEIPDIKRIESLSGRAETSLIVEGKKPPA